MNKNRTTGFTLIELLTALGIVAILIALLLPALKKVRMLAFDTKQKGQINAVEIAIETYRTDFAMYPSSGYYPVASNIPRDSDSVPYYGTEKLAEALLGYDLLGVHQDVRTNFDKLGQDASGNSLYADAAGKPINLDARKGPYLETDQMNPVESDSNVDLFDLDAGGHYIGDVYGRDSLKTGMPLLYYKAKPDNRIQNAAVTTDKVYDYRDSNMSFVTNASPDADAAYIQGRGTIWNTIDGSKTAEKNFDDFITNLEISTDTAKIPYRAQSYLLISAGYDGVYGTSDDVCNFERK